MRFLFASTIQAIFGGSEHLWIASAHCLLAKGHIIGVYLPYYKTFPELERLVEAGVVVFYGSAPPRRLTKRIQDFASGACFDLAACLDRFQPDHVVVSMGNHLESGCFFEDRPVIKVPYSLVVQLVMLRFAPADERAYFSRFFEDAERVFFVSEENRQLAEVDLGVSLQRARVIGNEFRREPTVPWPGSQPLALAVPARLEFPQKGHDFILRAARDLQAEIGSRLVIRFYSDSSPHRVLEYCHAHSIRNVEILPFTSLAGIWSNNHGLLLTSRFEGMSLAMLEAMWMERPSFVTPCAGVAETVVDGVNGLVAASISAEAVKELLLRALELEAEWRTMGVKAREHLSMIFPRPTSEVLAEALLQSPTPRTQSELLASGQAAVKS